MGYAWTIYAPVSVSAAERAVEAMYAALAEIVGEDIAEDIEPGDDLEPASLGIWPDIAVARSASIPTVEEASAWRDDPNKTEKRFEAAAIARLPKCTTRIAIDRPQGFDPALVSALRFLLPKLGPSLFSESVEFDLTTSETLLKTLAKHPDLESAQEDDDEDGDADDDDDDADDPVDDEPVVDDAAARPEVLRALLGEIAQHARLRRRVGELLHDAPPTVGAYAEHLARAGAQSDTVAAKALKLSEADVGTARRGLAALLAKVDR